MCSIKHDIAWKYAENHYLNKVNNSTGCIFGILGSTARFGFITEGLTQINYQIKNLHEKRFSSRRDKLNKIIIHSEESLVSNNSPKEQDAYSLSYSLEVTKTDAMTSSLTAEIGTKFEVDIPFVEKTTIEARFSGTESETHSISEKFTVTAPSQKISLDPFTKMNVTYDFYQYFDINDYFLDFVIDDSSTISYPNYVEAIYYGDLTCCSACFLYKNENIKTSRLKDFLHQIDFSSNIQNMLKWNNTLIKLDEKDDKFILRNLGKTSEKIMNFGVDIYFGQKFKI